MYELKSENKESNDSKINSKFAIPVYITLFFGVLYLLGWWYTYSYFSYFNLYEIVRGGVLEFTPYYYLEKAFIPFVIGILFFLFHMSIPKKSTLTLFSTAIENFFIILVGILFILYSLSIESFNNKDLIIKIWLLSLGLLLSCIYIILLYKKYSFLDYFVRLNKMGLTLIIFLIIMLVLLNGGFIAEIIAKNDVKGGELIQFSWKEKTPKNMEGKDLVPIIYQNGNYYVVERQKVNFTQPIVYIIPENEIEFAILKSD